MEFRRLYLPDIIEWDEEQTTDTFGRLEVTPLERGFGRTLGTALRRVLLSSIEGSAPVAIKIEGVKHEFTALDGVVEDVPEIILNVKSLGIRHQSEEPGILRVDVEGPADVKAGDLEGDDFLSIANSDDPDCPEDSPGDAPSVSDAQDEQARDDQPHGGPCVHHRQRPSLAACGNPVRYGVGERCPRATCTRARRDDPDSEPRRTRCHSHEA